MAQSNIFQLPDYGNIYQQYSNPNFPQAPNLSFEQVKPAFMPARPTEGPLSDSYAEGLDQYSRPGTVEQPDTGFSLGDWTKLGTGIANAYLGYEGLQLGKEQFGFAKGSFNKNLANQAQLINNRMEDQARARRGFSGGSTDQADLDAYLESRKVSGAPV